MPNSDLHQKFDQRVYELELSSATARYGGSSLTLSAGGYCFTRWCPDYLTTVEGFRMELAGSDTGVGTGGTTATLSIPLLGVSVSHSVSATTLVDCSCHLEIDEIRLYSSNGGILELRIEAMRWYVDGVLRWSTGVQYFVNDAYFSPAGVPLFGIPPEFGAGASTAPVPILPANPTSTVPGMIGAEVSATITGSWRDRETSISDFVGYPYTISLGGVPSVSCPCSSEPFGTLSSGTTLAVEITASERQIQTTTYRGRFTCNCPEGQTTIRPATIDVYDTAFEFGGHSGWVCTFPNLTALVRRLDPDNYRAMIIRGGFPKTERISSAICQTVFPPVDPGDLVSETITEQVQPRQSAILGNVSGATHAMEDTFGFSLPSPAGKYSGLYTALSTSHVVITGALCEIIGGGGGVDSDVPPCYEVFQLTCSHTLASVFAPYIDELADNPQMLGFLYHIDSIPRYLNYWGSRNWSYFYWFPVNTIDTNADEIPDAQDQWPVYSAPSAVEYWLFKGDQWEYQSALPGGEQTKLRTTLVSAPLVHGCQGLFIKNLILGVESSWWGDATFKVDSTVPADEITPGTDSEPDWSYTDCTGALDSTGVVLTPSAGEFTVIAELALGNFVRKPYLYPHICDRFYFDWENTNVASLAVYLVGQSGSIIKIADVQGEAFRPLNPSDDKYAGSWKQDFGAGFYIDEGSDLLAEGVSASYMLDPELVHAFSLLGGRTAKAIRFVVEVVSDAATVKILYPKFRSCDSNSRTYQENKSQGAVVWANGPGIRFGNAAWYYDAAHHETPIVLPPGFPPLGMKPSSLDWLTFRRLMLEAKAFDDGLGTEIGNLYDPYEATTPAALDLFSGSFLIPSTNRVFPRAALVNGASCPPVLSFPRRARGLDWSPTGDFAQETVSHAVEPRFMIGNDITNIVNPADGLSWSAGISGLSGWPVTVHLHAVENDEPQFYVQRGSIQIALMSPWQGCFSVRRKGKAVRDLDLHNFRGLGLMFEAQATDDDVTVVGYNIEDPAFSKDAIAYVSSLIQMGGITIVCKSDGTIFVAFEESGAVKSVRSKSLGEYWGSAVALGITGKWVDACEEEARGIEFILALDHTAGTSGARPWKIYRKAAESASFVFLASIVTQAEADVTGGNIYFSDERGRPLIFSYADSGVVRRFRSFDHGESWVEVT